MKTNATQLTYSPSVTLPAPKPGGKLQYREFNSRSHHGPDAECVSVSGKLITVLIKGRRSEWLLRDFLPYGHHGTNDRFEEQASREVRNDCLGKSWEQIEAMQGGKLSA